MSSERTQEQFLPSLQAKVDALERVQGMGLRVRSRGGLRSPVEHIRDAPLESKEFWVKQINQERLTNLGRAALDTAFSGFGDLPADEKRKTEYAELMSAHLKIPYGVDRRTMRRWAGDQTLPRGRYYTLCDEYGNDQGTLIGELRAYYTPSYAGVVQIFDCTLPENLENVRTGLEIPATDPNMLLFSFPPLNGNANAFVAAFSDVIIKTDRSMQKDPGARASLVSLFASNTLQVGLPLIVRKIRRERVLDLREPGSAAWLARTLSTLEWRADDQVIKCFPQRSSIERFADLLPELLTQEQGGGGACVAAGILLRHLGADGIIFPSARNDNAVVIKGGKVVGHCGWNFVDYAGASPPEVVVWREMGKQWPTQFGYRPYADEPETAVPVWYPEVRGMLDPNGGWQLQGLRKRSDWNWRKQLLRYALDCSRDDISENTWGTLRTYPEVAADGGHIDVAGILAKLIFEAVLGLDDADKELTAMGEQLRTWTPLQESIAELLDKVHGPSREKRKTVQAFYFPYAGYNDEDLANSTMPP